MQQTSSSERLFRLIRAIAIVIVFSAVFFGSLWGFFHFVRVEKIIVEGYTGSELLRGLSSYYNQNLVFISTKKIEQTLLDENPQIRSISIQKIFPNSLRIFVTQQPILAQLEMNYGYVYLSGNGRVVQKARTLKENFPLIRYYQKMNYAAVSPGDELQYKEVVTSLHFVKKLSELGFKTITIDISGPDMLLFSLDDKKIYFTIEKDISIQEYELEQIIKQFRIEGKEFKNLDVRFEKPIIQF